MIINLFYVYYNSFHSIAYLIIYSLTILSLYYSLTLYSIILIIIHLILIMISILLSYYSFSISISIIHYSSIYIYLYPHSFIISTFYNSSLKSNLIIISYSSSISIYLNSLSICSTILNLVSPMTSHLHSFYSILITSLSTIFAHYILFI